MTQPDWPSTGAPAGAPVRPGWFEQDIGRRLRDARRARGLSLKAAAVASAGRFRTSTLGAYERGERAMAVGRLPELAELYGVSVLDLLPGAEGAVIDLTDTTLARADLTAALEQALATLQQLRDRLAHPSHPR